MKKSFFCSLLAWMGLLPFSGVASQEEDLATVIEEARKQYGLNAVVVDVRNGDEPLLQRAFGESTTDVSAGMGMKVRVGGVCLTSVTALLLQAVEEDRVSLEDTVDNWYPDLPNADEVTLRMLANCTAGYGDYVPNEDFQNAFYADPFRSFTPEELIEYGVGDAALYAPGTDWNYSHTNFVILGEIVSRIFDQPIPALLEERVIEPLGLADTVYTPDPEIPGPVLHAFTTERGVFEDSTHWNPSWTSYTGSMAATVGDVARIAEALVTAELFSVELLGEMTAPTAVGLAGNKEDRYYGLGVGVFGGGKWLVQNPNFGGYQGVMAANLETGQVVAVFATLGRKSDPETHHGMLLFEAIRNELDTNASKTLR